MDNPNISRTYSKVSLIATLLLIFSPTVLWYILSPGDGAIIYGGFLSIFLLIWYAANWGQTESMCMKIETTMPLLEESISQDDFDMEDILSQTKRIEKIFLALLSLRKSWFTRIVQPFQKDRIQDIVSYYMYRVLKVLRDLQLRLIVKIDEQRKLLEAARKNMDYTSGPTELAQTVELQKARLDRQIEQFEELQRVLVKV